MIKRLTRDVAIVAAFALAILGISSGPAAAMAPHATGPGFVLELQQNPAWINMGVVSAEYNTPQAQLPAALRSSNQCYPYQYCAWTGANYSGTFYAWNTAYNDYCVPTQGSMNDSITSFWNRMPQYTAYLYINSGCQNPAGWGGDPKIFYPYAGSSDIRCYIAGCWQYDNAVSSFRTL